MARVEQRPVLEHLRQAARELVVGQRREDLRIDEHHPREVERAQQVLALRQIDRDLASDRRVDLGEQRRGALHEGDAPHEGGCNEPGQIADDPAAEGHDRVAPAQPRVQELAHQAHDVRGRLRGLAGRDS